MLLEVKELVKEYRGGVRANDGISLAVDQDPEKYLAEEKKQGQC